MCELREKLKKKEKKLPREMQGFFIGRGVKKLSEICKKKPLNWNMILEKNKKFVKKKKKKRLHRNYDVIDKWKMGTSNSVEF